MHLSTRIYLWIGVKAVWILTAKIATETTAVMNPLDERTAIDLRFFVFSAVASIVVFGVLVIPIFSEI